ncbi:fimbrial protein [Salmonella enterica]|uniref:fimbrial protein n=1 Tax=Salmonella enterica TaxID=28901 RepID=UPI003EDC816A|nr:fimbrial protein [Salmonella enterica subsp. enterica serovar Bredeney]HCB5294626.1 fimbrial protein [Salmonella enterica subsp. enterica serovar Bredeney]
MKKQLLCGVVAGALAIINLGVLPGAHAANGTSSLDLTVEANLTTGTCSATVMDGDTETTTIKLGDDIALSEVIAKSRVKPFKVRFTDCAGLPESTASLRLARRGGSCAGSNGPAFRNQGGTSAGIGLEVWTTAEPEGNGSVQLICNSPNTVTVNVSTAKGTTNMDYDLSARLVDVTGVGTATAGTFTSPTVLTISYK